MIHVFTGTDDGAVAEAALKHFNASKPNSDDDFANDIIDGNADNAEHAYQITSDTIQALQTLPFFGGKKTVWLKRATFMASDRTSEAARSKAGVEALLETLKAGLGDSINFVLSATGIDKRRAFYKWLKANATIEEHNKLDTSKEGWEEKVAILVNKRAKELGLTFTEDALELFVTLAGEDTRQISVELEKLDLYLGKERRKIELDDIRKMVPLSRAAVVFEIGRALQRRDGVRALELIDQQLAKNESAIAILRASLIPTIRNLFMAKAVMEQYRVAPFSFANDLKRIPSTDLLWLPQKKAGGVNTWGLQMAARDAISFPLPALRKAMESCLAADRSLVTTSLDHRTILHRLIVELIAATKKN